jgi:uncharacterized protein (DUF433 family)
MLRNQKRLFLNSCVYSSMQNLLDRITINPDICHGKPTIRDKRYTVELILDLLSAGMTNEEILQDYPALEIDDIRAAIVFGDLVSKNKNSFCPINLLENSFLRLMRENIQNLVALFRDNTFVEMSNQGLVVHE